MKGKKKNKKLAKVLVLAVCFVLTIIVSASVTLAWFYDSDWASDSITMAGAVGIEMRNSAGTPTSGAGSLHFKISTNYAYPGQAMDLQASVFNNGGSSITNYYKNQATPVTNPTDPQIQTAGNANVGSKAYIRAQVILLTNMNMDAEPDKTTKPLEWEEWNDSQKFNARAIYTALNGLITTNNSTSATTDWVYDRVQTVDDTTYKGTIKFDSADHEFYDYGYYYLCYDKGTSPTLENVLYPLSVGHNAAFLFKNTFIIPWTLTNITADKEIYIGVKFEAIQTFIPRLNETYDSTTKGWSIYSGEMDNQADDVITGTGSDGYQNFYYSTNVQIVFNTSRFAKIKFTLADGSTYTVGETNNPSYSMITGLEDDDFETNIDLTDYEDAKEQVTPEQFA